MDWRKKVWEDENKKNKFNKNMAKCLRYSLALENYLDNTGKYKKLINEVWEKEANVQEAKFHEPEDKLVEMSKELLEEFKKVVEKVGKEKFTFYEDDDLEYNWIKIENR